MVDDGERSGSLKRPPRVTYKTKLKIKFPTFPKFIERYSQDISEGGMFIYSKNPKPVASKVVFEIVEKEGNVILKGEGRVRWIREFEPSKPEKEPGMGIEFTGLSDASKALVKKIVAENLKVRGTDQEPQAESETVSAVASGEEAVQKPMPGKDKAPSVDIGEMISEAQVEDKEERDQIRTKGFFKEEIPPKEPAKKRTESKVAPVVGMDLGTTFSCVGFVKDGKPVIIPSRKGHRTIPSIVAYPKDKELLIGNDAKPFLLTDPEHTVYGSKRMLGRKYKSRIVDEIKHYFKYAVVEGDDGDVAVDMHGRKIPLPIVSSLILKELKTVAEDYFARKVTTAVITVPAHYNNRQRESVKEAGKLAGLEVKRIVNEPTAAALAYGLDKNLSEKVLIYDLGGGTFDVAVMDISNNVFEVLASGGDSFLGGIDFDRRIAQYLLEKFKEKSGIDLSTNDEAMQRIKEAAEKAKIDLSIQSHTIVNIPFIAGDDKNRQDLVVELARDRLSEMAADLVDKTLRICHEVLRVRNLKRSDIDEIILVGGQTRMPLVGESLLRVFGKRPKKGVHPDEVVALGAALLADTFDKVDSVVLLDSLSIPIGVGLPGGRFKPIIPKNTRIPFEKTYTLSTTKDNQTSIDIDIFQGEATMLDACEYLGSFVVDRIPKAKKGEAKIHLNFSLDGECILNLQAKESLSGRVIETRMVVRETPETIKQQFEKEKN